MKRNNKYKYIILFALIVLSFFGCGRAKEKKTKKPPSIPVNIAIQYVQGVKNTPSIITLNLYSRITRQASYYNINKKEEDKKEVKPVKLSLKKSTWKDDVVFYIYKDKADESGKKLTDAELVFAPKETKLVLGPKDTIIARYKIPPVAVPAAGQLLQAKMKAGKYNIVSNKVIIPETKTSGKGILLRQAFIESELKDYDKLLQTADKLIAEAPASSWGYWYKGLALEGQGSLKEALTAYQTALKKVPLPKPGENREPPTPIFTKIRELKKELKL